MINRIKWWVFYTFGERGLEQTYTGHGDRFERRWLRIGRWYLYLDEEQSK